MYLILVAYQSPLWGQKAQVVSICIDEGSRFLADPPGWCTGKVTLPCALALGTVFLYRRQASATSIADYRYAPVKRDLWGRWRVGAGGKCSSAAGEQATVLVNFHAHYLWYTYSYDEMVSYSVICGRATSVTLTLWDYGLLTPWAIYPYGDGWKVDEFCYH